MSTLKESWSKTGKSFGTAFSGLGKSLVRTVGVTVQKVNKWANDEKEAAPSDASAPADTTEEKR